MALLKMDEVSFASRGISIIDSVSLAIQEGTVTEFHGPSGGGKSTLLKLLAGILVPVEGTVYYQDKDIASMSRQDDLEFRKDCSFVFQDSALWANQTIAQNLLLPLQVHFPKQSTEQHMDMIRSVCASVKYDRDINSRPADLSAGEQKKIAFARALISGPKVLFLDECTANLDDQNAQVIIRLLHEYVDKGNTIIYISHNEKFRWEFPGYLYEIKGGRAEMQSIDIDDLR